jgi:hypothetical protein
VFTVRYALRTYIKQIRFVFKGLIISKGCADGISQLTILLFYILFMYVIVFQGFTNSGLHVAVVIKLFNHPPPRDAAAPTGPGTPHYRGFTITLRHATLSTIRLDG